MATILTSQGLAPDRAPRLRRLAARIDEQADFAAFPSRARRLARDMRIRATELELGGEPPDTEDSYSQEIHAIGFAAS